MEWQKFKGDSLFNEQKEDDKAVNIFQKHNYCVTICLSIYCKTYCFAFQKRMFYTVKAAVLQRKTYAFATPNRNYHFSYE